MQRAFGGHLQRAARYARIVRIENDGSVGGADVDPVQRHPQPPHQVGDPQPRGQADLPRAVRDQHHDPGPRIRLALEVLQRLLQPGADVGLGQPAPDVAGRDRGVHRIVVAGELQDRDREGAEHHHPEQVLVPLRDELGEELAGDLTLGPVRPLGRRIHHPPDREGPVHAGAAVDQQHHVGAAPDALDLVFGPVQAARGEHQRRDGQCADHPQPVLDPGRERIPGDEAEPGVRDRRRPWPQKGQRRQRQQREHPAVHHPERRPEDVHPRRSRSRHARHSARRRSRLCPVSAGGGAPSLA